MARTSNGQALIFLALTQAILASGSVKVCPSINPAVVGDNVTLSLCPPVALTSGAWDVSGSLIVAWLESQQAVSSGYTGRARVNVFTGALTLHSVTAADSGLYEVQSDEPPLRANTELAVLESVANVTVHVEQTGLMESKDSVALRCSASSGSLVSFLWTNGSFSLTAGKRIQLTDGGSALTIINVSRHDQGPFRCHASNQISNGTSEPVSLTIDYGPDNMALTVNSQNSTSFQVGSNLTLLCSAQSSPAAQLRWAVRGTLVDAAGPVLELSTVSQEQSGDYTCLAFNTHTHMRSSVTKHLLVTELSGCEQQATDAQLLSLLLLLGLLQFSGLL